MAKQGFCLDDLQRLEGGRSNLVFRCGEHVLKVYSPHSANPLFANYPAREKRVLAELANAPISPNLKAAGCCAGLNWLVYSYLAGSTWRSDARQVAQLLGDVHAYPCPHFLPKGANGSQELVQQVHDILQATDRDAGLGELEPFGHVTPTDALCLLHGDPVPGNIVIAAGNATLIDWQCPVLGDPAEDLAIFLSPAMQYLYRGAPLKPHDEAAFLAAYPRREVVQRFLQLRPWYHWRMAAYCQWRLQYGDPADRYALGLELEKLKSFIA